MSTSPVITEAAKTLATAADLGSGEAQVVLFASSGDAGFEFRRVNPTKKIQNRFRDIASRWAAGLQNRELVMYGAGRVPSSHELAVLALAGQDAIQAATSPLAQPLDIQVFNDPNFANDLRFYVVAAKTPNPGWLYFFKAKGETLRLKRTLKVALVPTGNAYDELKEDPLIFDPTFDAVVDDSVAVIANQASFERALGFIEAASTAAQSTLTQLLSTVTVTNGPDFLAAASTDVNMIAKLRSIAEKMSNPAYAAAMTTTNLITFANARGIAIDTEVVNGSEQLVFHPDPQHRWRILKLLDDDYLHSSLTTLDYEVNSKSPM